MKVTRDKEGKIQISSKDIRKGLDEFRSCNYTGKIVINHGLGEAIPVFHPCNNVEEKAKAAEFVRNDPEYQETAQKVMEEISKIVEEYSEMELILTTMDEVFNDGRLPLYLAATEAAQKYAKADYPYYVTFHFLEGFDDMRHTIQKTADYFGGHMYSWEWFLARGNTFEDYHKELADRNGKAGFYYNPVGYFYTPGWYRAVMGIEFFVSDVDFHVPWRYYYAYGSPYAYPESKGSHIFGFYDRELKRPVSAMIWEGYREGQDDYRYLYTLQQAIANAPAEKQAIAIEAEKFLTDLINSVPSPQGLPHGNQLIGTHQECPWTNEVTNYFKFDGFQKFRRTCADYIVQLQK